MAFFMHLSLDSFPVDTMPSFVACISISGTLNPDQQQQKGAVQILRGLMMLLTS